MIEAPDESTIEGTDPHEGDWKASEWNDIICLSFKTQFDFK